MSVNDSDSEVEEIDIKVQITVKYKDENDKTVEKQVSPLVIDGNYVCPINNCQFMNSRLAPLKTHARGSVHTNVGRPIAVDFSPYQLGGEFSGDIYVPKCLEGTAIVVDAKYNVAVCLVGQYVLGQLDIPTHCKVCPFCQSFDQDKYIVDPDFKRIEIDVDLDPFKLGMVDRLNSGKLPLVTGKRPAIVGLPVRRRHICLLCLKKGVETTFNPGTRWHMFKVHKLGLSEVDRNLGTCYCMAFRQLGDSTTGTPNNFHVVERRYGTRRY
uniref:ARAD1A02222p n=1 Tax=Blastobotrys adeninivorans TaxID=409370 RepID=A0A060T2K7_BLAAD